MPRRRLASAFLTVSALCALAAAPLEAKVIRVPQDIKDLQTAIRSVRHGDVIEMKGGVYPAPANAFGISNTGKAFTIRAAPKANVILDGRGLGTILRFKNGSRARGKRVTFERITFRNGVSATEGDGGAVTLTAAEARFVDCRFLNNTASGRTTGGGAVRVLGGSDATFVRTELRGNSSLNRGGALEVLFSTVAVEGGTFAENRTNLPGHKGTSSGGAIYVLDSVVRISDARFERNQAGWVGGAIYAYGNWSATPEVPTSDLTVVRSTFVQNEAINNPCCAPAGPTQGGAIHVENQTTLRVQYSQLLGNQAKLGGAIDNYRAVVEVTGSVFEWNRAVEGAALGAGGAIFAASNETGADGLVNRRTSVVRITDSLVQGGLPVPMANTGGCVVAGGDASRIYGENGAVPIGTVDENRARIEVRRSVFADCDVQRDFTGGGFGGALHADLAHVLLEDSLVIESDARGDGAGGGGVSVQRESVATIVRTTFARNTAERWGGALFVGGSLIHVAQSRFFGNDVRPGFSEPMGESRGAAIYTIPFLSQQRPDLARNVAGLVTDSLFSENVGLPVWDVDPPSGPINEVRYDNNQFFETTFFDKVYVNSLVDSGGAGVSSLNRLVVNRGFRGSTLKSAVSNTRLSSPPTAGTLLAAPPVVGTGAPRSPTTFLGYAWSGRSASLDGQPLAARSGLYLAGRGSHSLMVDGTPVTFLNVGVARLAAGRFQVRVLQEGGREARLIAQEADTVFFSLPGGTLAVQVLDRSDENGHFWVARSVSNVSGASGLSGHTVEITDTLTGETRTWGPLSGVADSEVDSRAFPAH